MVKDSLQNKVFSALNHPIRQEIIRMLYERDPETLARDDIEKAIQSLHEVSEDSSEQFLSSKAINFHLKKLQEAGLIQRYGYRYQLTKLGRETAVFLFKVSELLGRRSTGEYKRSVGSYISGFIIFSNEKEIDQFMECLRMEKFFTIIKDDGVELELKWLDSRFWSSIIFRKGQKNKVVFSSEVRLFEDGRTFDMSKEEDEEIMIRLVEAVNGGILSYIVLNARKVNNNVEIVEKRIILR